MRGAIARVAEKTILLDGERRLTGQGRGQSHLVLAEAALLLGVEIEDADHGGVSAKGNGEEAMEPLLGRGPLVRGVVSGVADQVFHDDWLTSLDDETAQALAELEACTRHDD